MTAAVQSGWDEAIAAADDLDVLVYRSRLLAADRSIVNFGGGNTSVKARYVDHIGREIDVLWVKASGSDLATVTTEGFCGLRLDEVLPLQQLTEMPDEAMVAHLGRCQLAPKMPRPSIETLLHAFIPHRHVDHTHPDAVGAIVGAVGGEQLAYECFGAEALWIPYIRPGFALSKQIGDAVAANPSARFVLMAKHGLVAWGDTAQQSYEATLEAVNRATAFINLRRDADPVTRRTATDPESRQDLLARVLPSLRGAVSRGSVPKILQVDVSEPVMSFIARPDAEELSQVGAACPDHLVHTKRRPLWVRFDPSVDTGDALATRIEEEVARFRAAEIAYVERNRSPDDAVGDPNPRVVLIEGIGLVSVGRNATAARLARDLYQRAIAVMEGAATLGGFVSLDDAESYAVEYWPLELYKLSLAPAPKELEGRVALVTGGAGGIGAAIARRLAEDGTAIVLLDLNEEAASAVARELTGPGIALAADVTSESAVAAAFQAAVLAFGGIDIVVSNAGIASSAAIQETSLALWERNHRVLGLGYFLVSREAARVLRDQGLGGSIVFIASKNGLVAGRNAAAYSSAKAAELHLARCLAEELGADGVRVNSINPDAVLRGSKIWDSSWREERAAAYGIAPDELEEHYRARTTLKVNVYPEDIAEAVAFFASERRSGKSTGNIVNVDGGVSAAYTR